MYIIVDFDATCAPHGYPSVRCEELENKAAEVLKELYKNGHNLILSTMRSNGIKSQAHFGDYDGLKNAENWFKENGIPLYASQTNPSQHLWTDSPKCYGNLIIDDTCIGIPLRDYFHVKNGDTTIEPRKMVCWSGIRELLRNQNLI